MFGDLPRSSESQRSYGAGGGGGGVGEGYRLYSPIRRRLQCLLTTCMGKWVSSEVDNEATMTGVFKLPKEIGYVHSYIPWIVSN